MIYVVNKKRKDESIKKEFPNADIPDCTRPPFEVPCLLAYNQ